MKNGLAMLATLGLGGLVINSFQTEPQYSQDNQPVVHQDLIKKVPVAEAETSVPEKAIVAPAVQKTEPKKDIRFERNCHLSYSGCLNPNAIDYDCEGGSGNGPYYTGLVQVLGPDVFDLDRDNNGWGCE